MIPWLQQHCQLCQQSLIDDEKYCTSNTPVIYVPSLLRRKVRMVQGRQASTAALPFELYAVGTVYTASPHPPMEVDEASDQP